VQTLAALFEGVLAFVATNVDDLLVVFLFFAGGARLRSVMLGQYLGFAAIVALSAVVALGALALPEWVGRWLAVVPFAIGLRGVLQEDDGKEDDRPREAAKLGELAVAAITVANGGDNVAVYVPLFAGRSGIAIAVILAVFFVGVGALTAGAHRMTRVTAIAQRLDRWGHRVAPWLLMALGAVLFFR